MLTALCLFILFPLTIFSAECLVNGDFSNVLTGWKTSPALGNELPYMDPAGCVSTNESGYEPADILHQPLSVDSVAGHTFTVSADLGVRWAQGSGQTIGLYLDYLTNTGERQRVLVVNPDDQSIPESRPLDPAIFASFSGHHTFATDADRLVGLTIARVNENGAEFYLDNVSVSCATRTPGQPPFIATGALPPLEYGENLILEGHGFGNSGQLYIGGSQTGINVTEWTPTRIEATVQAPCPGGELELYANGSRNWQKRNLRITSPHYIATVNEESHVVIAGQIVSIPIDVAFQAGYTTTGISLSVSDRSGFADFDPPVLTRAGGSVLRYDTSGLPVGMYSYEILAQDEAGVQVIGTVDFDVRQVSQVELMIEGNPIPNPITNPNYQYCSFSIIDTEGRDISHQVPIPAWSSSDPWVVEFFREEPDTPWGSSYLLPHSDGSATLTATFADGTQFDLPVVIDLPNSPAMTSLSWSPSVITNSPDDTSMLSVQTTNTMTRMSWSSSGGMSHIDSMWGADNRSWYGDFSSEGVEPGTYLLLASAEMSTPSGTVKVSDGALLTVVNDPTTGLIKGAIFMMDNSEHFEISGTLELYHPDDLTTPIASFPIWNWATHFTVPRVTPGTYLVRFFSDMSGDEAWFPSASSPVDASPVLVEAGSSVEGINFIFGPALIEEPPSVVTPPSVSAGASGDEFRFEVMAESGRNYLIQKSYTLDEGSWFTIGTIWGYGESEPVVDDISNNDQAFYRVIQK